MGVKMVGSGEDNGDGGDRSLGEAGMNKHTVLSLLNPIRFV